MSNTNMKTRSPAYLALQARYHTLAARVARMMAQLPKTKVEGTLIDQAAIDLLLMELHTTQAEIDQILDAAKELVELENASTTTSS